jgi:hypothetical protein
MQTKDTNPKDAVGSLKVPLHLIPAPVQGELALALLEGSLKYGAFNYRVAGVRTSVYYDACRRHLDAYMEGEDTDPDSGLPHVVKAMACLCILRDADRQGMLNDDRPPRSEDGWVQELNEKAKALIESCEEPVAPYTQKGLE